MPQLAPEKRLKMVEEFLKSRLRVNDLCKKYNTTARTLYRWVERHKNNFLGWGHPVEAVKNSRRHPKLNETQAVTILCRALERPKLGPKTIAEIVNSENRGSPTSATTVYNILTRCALNTYPRRLQQHHLWVVSNSHKRDKMIRELLERCSMYYTYNIRST